MNSFLFNKDSLIILIKKVQVIFLRKNVYETCETMIRIAITITIRKCHLLETNDLDKQTNKPKHDNIKDNKTINLHNTKDT